MVHLGTTNRLAIITSVIGLIVILAAQKYIPKIPGALLGLLASTFVAVLFFQGQVVTLGSAYGEIPRQLPSFAFPELTIEKMMDLLPPAIVIALLGGVESILSAMVADNMKGSKHDSNKELVGQGIANMAAPLFGGIPATGAIARTATNIKNGGASPIFGVVHGIVVLLILMLFAPYAFMIPLAAMAPILMFVALNLADRSLFLMWLPFLFLNERMISYHSIYETMKKARDRQVTCFLPALSHEKIAE